VTKDPKQRLADIDAVFAALDHAARRQIVMTVHFWGGSMMAGEIAARFGHAWPTTTRHLQVLTDARLLTMERVGRTRVYRLNRARLKIVSDWLGWFELRAGAKAKSKVS
jgi:DNA-binding transcriptional ArsR family regulator